MKKITKPKAEYTPSGNDITDGRITRVPKEISGNFNIDETGDRPSMEAGDGLLPSSAINFRENHHSKIPSSGNSTFPFTNHNDTGFVLINGVSTPIPDINAYQNKKTLAQGMMDLALLSANANQLRYVLESYKRHPYYYPSVIFICLSIVFQIGVGIGLILNSKYNVKNQKEICRANKINNYTVIGIFIVTFVNVFISAFGVADPQP